MHCLLGIGKRGDKSLRRLLVQCARVYLQRLDYQHGPLADWVRALLGRLIGVAVLLAFVAVSRPRCQ